MIISESFKLILFNLLILILIKIYLSIIIVKDKKISKIPNKRKSSKYHNNTVKY